jgi:hypothetical protein
MTIEPKRVAAEIEGDFVVFLIGMRINRMWKIHKWLPVMLAMNRMMKELRTRVGTGFLGSMGAGTMLVQYWRSFDQLEAYARSADHEHWPAWVAFNRRMARSRGDVGIWHETYLVRAGEYETIYSAMPRFGLAAASRAVPAGGRRDTARGRLGLGVGATENG